MTRENKELLIKDLCTRLPYGVICRCRTTEDSTWWNTDQRIFGITGGKFDIGSDILEPEQIKPYLRPISSMIEEEKEELKQKFSFELEEDAEHVMYYFISVNHSIEMIDWFNEHHFDYRSLIKKGLALEAKEGMYKTE